MTTSCAMQSNKYKINIPHCDHEDTKIQRGDNGGIRLFR